ncbi:MULTISPECIES: hypothetical protein [unclassified Bradyrhizobium]|uniref:hypothetical protein n=1 Tax=unclassified Bradyrhizobium TaxID=2631580 RepID=UPI001FFA7C1A|nr:MULTISPECIES: hypothetical protein [unclassified Bradyrhizobium]MCK1325058.1 hypothetical protein [Bradyrhizobium sp. 156]MCK1498441.1 hypothetical protein [Bradyrhizobium sp. 188]
MNLIERIYRADDSRKSRFHTASGVLCLNPIEIGYAGATTLGRLLLKSFVKRPWLVTKAWPRIEERATGARIFEYGAGMSTLWFSERAAELVSVESNLQWAARINAALAERGKPPIVLLEDPEAYAGFINSCADPFDILLVDGIVRRKCVEQGIPHLKKGGLLVLDNTDVNKDLIPAALAAGPFEVTRYSGYAPGSLHPNETSLLVKQF